MDDFDVRPVLETLFFVSDSPIRLETLVEILPETNKEQILEGIRQIQAAYEDSSKGIELIEIAGGYQFRTKPIWAGWVARLKKTKAVKLSQAALETLAIISYRQPVIRPTIEEIRGVDSGSVVHTLLEKGLIKLMGRKDLPGRPMVYGTTKTFLELFGLKDLSDLPTLKEIQAPQTPGMISLEEIQETGEETGVSQPQLPSEDDTVASMIQPIEPAEIIPQDIGREEGITAIQEGKE